ncbi:MAG TPA: phospholipase D family protein [Burkholderiaceae bacterium]
MTRGRRAWWPVAVALLVGACAAPIERPPRAPPQAALAPRADGGFAAIEAAVRSRGGADASGFELLTRNEDGLRWRLALIDSARHSIDAQYYVWYGDVAGKLLLKHLLDAAARGVRVRVLVDDLTTLLKDASTVSLGDAAAALIDAQPNLELRLFNPWLQRGLLGRAAEALGDMDRLNQRMHNKALIVDNQATILGGRNVGDEYLGLNAQFNFLDLDVLGIGPVARQASAAFDAFWNSRWVMPASALRTARGGIDGVGADEQLLESLRAARSIERFPLSRADWSQELAALADRLHVGSSRVHFDVPEDGRIRHAMAEQMLAFTESAARELRIVNAYIILGEPAIAALQRSKQRGVDIRILTNSLASQDVPAVNSHYKGTRKALREATSGLFEMRHDAAVQATYADTPPTRAGFMGLHAKAMVVDRQRLYIGSMNFDPRSKQINTEMGVFIDSPSLAAALALWIELDMAPANAWRVEVTADGSLTWTHDHDTVTRQPARHWWQRIEDVFFMAFPSDLY